MDVQKILADLQKKHPGEPQFLQAVTEVLESVKDVYNENPKFEKNRIMERIIEPDRVFMFKVPWEDDKGEIHVNIGYRVQFNGAIGPYKGGIRFQANVTLDTMKFLGFEQTFKNALTTLPMGGGKGGSDFDPTGRSDAEVRRFCEKFVMELWRHIGAETDVPAGDMGVGGREIGYMYGMYKKLAQCHTGVFTGKGMNWGGSKMRPEATGYGAVFFLNHMLAAHNDTIKGKRVAVSGFGNVAWGACEKLVQLGAKVVCISGPDGYILDEAGMTQEKVNYMLELRASNQNVVAPYEKKFPGSKFIAGKKPWEVKADMYIPCATQNEILIDDAKAIVASGAKYVCEGSNMSSSNEAIEYMLNNGIILGPSKAANAGGVACSCIEMGQNSGKTVFKPEQVHAQLKDIMVNIHDAAKNAAEEYGYGYNLVAGANIAGFLKVADSMIAQGCV